MPFPFTFTFSLTVPGLSNPFAAPPLYPYQQTNESYEPSSAGARKSSSLVEDEDELSLTRNQSNGMNSKRRVSPSPIDAGNSRKRGWEPAFAAEPSLAPSFVTVSNGYLDTPSQHRERMQTQNRLDTHEQAVVDEQLQPPAKRRRTLAGSIVSTAVNAALVGTAVGLTVYRLWRNRGVGKDTEPPVTGEPSPSPPPPPYSPPSPDVNVIPPTPRNTRKSRRSHEAHSTRRRPTRKALYNVASFGPSTSTSQSALFPPTQPAFDFSSSHASPSSSPRRNRNRQTGNSTLGVPSDRAEGKDPRDAANGLDPDADDQMDPIDSLGTKLSFLIEQGKRALGREVVVMSEVEEDAVDDGSGAWIEEDNEGEFGKTGKSHRGRLSRSGSISRRRAAGSASITGSLGRRAGASMNIQPPLYDMSLDIPTPSPPASLSTFETSWESPELRETMERARAIVRERKSMNFRTDTGSSFS